MNTDELNYMVRSELGFNRLKVKGNISVGELIKEVSKALNITEEGLTLKVENKLLSQYPVLTPIKKVPQLSDMSVIDVIIIPKYKNVPPKSNIQQQPKAQEKVVYTSSGKPATMAQLQQHEQNVHETKEHILGQFCQHGPTAKCVGCMGNAPAKDDKPLNKCNHGPGGKCLNCTPLEDDKKKKQRKESSQLLCNHGPNGKCSNCIDNGQIEAKHISFDQFLYDMKFKCRGQHPEEGKCNNCLPPTAISYKVKKDCKNHAPYPKAMCNSCMPPSILLKRQQYRHVDYVEFLNIPEMSQLVQYWSSKQKGEQRMGFLYGYYAEDPNYKNGVRAIVEAIYEPPQKGSVGGFELLMDPFERDVSMIASGLGLEKIGWIFTTINHDCFLSSEEIRMAARFQQEYNVVHPSKCRVSKFLTVVLRTKKDNPDEVLPEVYMVSDQGQQLEYDGIFQNSGRRKILQVRQPVSEDDALPNFIYEGKQVTEFEPDFFIVNVAHGYNPNSNYNILKLYDFSVENRGKQQTAQELKQYLHKHQKKPSYIRYSDFHLLLYLSKLIDVHTIINVCHFIQEEQEVSENIQDIIKMYANQ